MSIGEKAPSQSPTPAEALQREVMGIVRQLVVEPIKNNDVDPRLLGIYRLPDLGGPVDLKYITAEVRGSYDHVPEDYREYTRLSLFEEFDEDAFRERYYSDDPVVELTAAEDNLGLIIAGNYYDERPDPMLEKARRFIGWLKPILAEGDLQAVPLTEAAVARLGDEAYLLEQAAAALKKWGVGGGLRLKTFVDGHRTLLVGDKGRDLSLIGDWVVAQDPEDTSATLTRDRVRLNFTAQGITVLEDGHETSSGVLRADNEVGQAQRIAELTTMVNQIFELAGDYDVIPMDDPYHVRPPRR